MTREEKCKLAIERGYTYDPETGLVYNKYGKIVNYINNNNGYIYISLTVDRKTKNLASHQFAWYCVHKECVEQLDHINGVKTDNRICNLRAVTNQQNQWNRIKAKGYSWFKRDSKWRAAIKINKKDIYLGCFNTEEEARQAYLNAKEIYHVI